jgi:hypothetical protein
MKANAILIDPKDNVATVTEAVGKGTNVNYFKEGKLVSIEAGEDIPVFHKLSLVRIHAGEHVIKYGEPIGAATQDIDERHLVSHLNIVSLPRDYEKELQ